MSNVVKKTLYGAVVVLAVYGAWALLQTQLRDDDRPPILVADGSLDIEALPDIAGSKGKFEKKGTSDREWSLQRQTGPPPTSFMVLVAHAAGCVDLLPYPGVTSITVAYEDGQTPPKQYSLTINIGKPPAPGPDAALFTFDHDVTPNTDSTFKVPDVKVTSVAFNSLTCTPAAGQKLKFIVFQKH